MSEPIGTAQLLRDAVTGFVVRTILCETGASVHPLDLEGFTGILISPLNPRPFSGRKLLKVLPVPSKVPDELLDTAEARLQELLAVSGVEYVDIRENGHMGVFFHSFETTRETSLKLLRILTGKDERRCHW